ncbi:Ig domain-containing protein [Arenimonas sp.]|uniref:Ig domain-containing protein n=1 Tax=Arenimonas sp. TaxID=1872635 RepID=UPI002E328135|nr:Ig domain-containing protein [Arenimonas sp.]HEX4853084.1 Ig domain-containing protein [Arenimonas sp.]
MTPRALTLALLALAASPALAVDQPSTYPGCATRSVSVPWGGSVAIDLKDCHSFGLGTVAKAPAHGSATPGANVPLDGYRYIHGGRSPAGGGRDRFVVLDDNSDTITVSVTIAPPASTPGLALTPAALPALQAGKPVSLAFAASGGTAPYTYRLASGALPPGLALAANGRLAGTPTARAAYAFDLAVRDARGAETRRGFGGTVSPGALSISPAAATAVRGQPVRLALTARGGVPPHRFAVESGRLPDGLRLSPEGVLSGSTGVSPGRFPLVLRVTDASTGDGQYFEAEAFSVQVVEPAPAKQ